MKESDFKKNFINKLHELYPGCVVLKIDNVRSFPDHIFLYKEFWAAFEFKRSKDASTRPNQEYWVNVLNMYSFSRFVYPENEEEVLCDLEQALIARR